jgi:hypothetical protein
MCPRLSVLFSCIAWALIGGCSYSHSAQTRGAAVKPEQRLATISIPPTGVIRISADDLLAQFRADPDAADRAFRDRTVEVTGKVVHVHKTKTGKPVITFGEIGRVLSPKVECYFQADDNLKVRVGQTCLIRGRCMGKRTGVSAPGFGNVPSCQRQSKGLGRVSYAHFGATEASFLDSPSPAL